MSIRWLRIQWLLVSDPWRIRPGKFQRWVVIIVGLACFWIGFPFAWISSPIATAPAIAHPHSIQPTQSQVDRLTKTCFQLLQQASYAQMLTTCTQAVESARALGDRSSEIYTLINLASAHGSLGQYSQAIDHAQQSLQLAQTLGDRQGEAYALINLSHAYQAIGQEPEAIHAAGHALEIAQELGDLQSEAYGLINLSSAHWGLEEYAKTLEYAERAWQIAGELGDRRGEVNALINLASAYGAQQDYPQAIAHAQQALQISQETGNRRGEALALSNLGDGFSGQQQFPEAEAYLRQAIEVFEQLRSTLPDAEKLSFFETLTNPYHTLQRVLVAQGKSTEALTIAERGRARALVDHLAQPLGTKAVAGNTPAAPITLAEIRQVARDQRATLVEYAIAATDQLYIWVVSPTGDITFRPVTLQQSSLGQLVNHARAQVFQGSSPTPLAPADGLQQLYQILIAPIQDRLPPDPNDHVVFVPHGSLFLVPFAALLAPDGTYLIQHHTLRIAPSIQALQLIHQLQQRQHQQPQAPPPHRSLPKALVVGNPTNDLPAAEQEAKAIARLLNTRPLVGKQATKAAVLQQISQASLIHLAVHAAPNQLDASYGGLMVLADPARGFSNLTTEEILALHLQAELVVLSGCSTGVSDVMNSDGVVGLARSMMMAGIPSILMSLWPVADGPTADLMQSFYHYWRPTPAAPSWSLEMFAVMGLWGGGMVWFKGSDRSDRPSPIQRGMSPLGHHLHHHLRHSRWMVGGCFILAILLVIHTPWQAPPTSPALDSAQALRQAMLTTLKTHPEPKNWAAFTLMGTAQ